MRGVAVDLALSTEQVAVQEAFADFFARESPIRVVRDAEPLGFSEKLWKGLVDMGAPAMSLPGSGADSLALCLVAEELGRRLAPVPLIDSWVAAHLLGRLDPDLADPLVDGAGVGTFALDPVREGTLRLVPSGAVSTAVVALDGTDLVLLRRSEPPAQQANFGSSPLADWVVPDADRSVLASGPAALELHREGRGLWKLLMSAALNGIQARALEIAVDYVKTREAFGRPIAWFQAIQHRLADVAVAGDGARYLTYEAAWARDGENRDEADRLAAMAVLFSAETSFFTCRESLQFHGGYGYTLEYDIQLYYRRAKAWPLALGDPRLELRAIAELTHPEED
jgi:alkylation response protein AidB-like acyl-CoA dehydrogenase